MGPRRRRHPARGGPARTASVNMAITTGIHTRPVSIPAGFDSLGATLFLPRGAAAPAPVVLMAHAAGDRQAALSGHAWHFARRGMAVLVFEHAASGECAGAPRQWVDTDRQLAAYTAALDWLGRCREVDGGRIALWGSHLDGGHALVAAARHSRRVRAVVAHCPHLEGEFRSWTYPRRLRAGALWSVAFDLLASALAQPQPCIPVAPRRGPRPDLPTDCGGRCRAAVAAGDRPINCVPARILLTSPSYRPLRDVRHIVCPVLMVAPEAGQSPALAKAAGRIPDCRLDVVPAGAQALQQDVMRQAAFLAEHLGLPPAPAAADRRGAGSASRKRQASLRRAAD